MELLLMSLRPDHEVLIEALDHLDDDLMRVTYLGLHHVEDLVYGLKLEAFRCLLRVLAELLFKVPANVELSHVIHRPDVLLVWNQLNKGVRLPADLMSQLLVLLLLFLVGLDLSNLMAVDVLVRVHSKDMRLSAEDVL